MLLHYYYECYHYPRKKPRDINLLGSVNAYCSIQLEVKGGK